MAVVIKVRKIAIKNRTTGEYDKFISAIAEETEAEMINNIEQAGEDQIEAINAILSPPSEDGNYILSCSVSNGTVTYDWLATE